eukprot:9761818-Ditylum_brightwellii.AAC.1
MGENPVKKLLFVASGQEDGVYMDSVLDLDSEVSDHVIEYGSGSRCRHAEQQQNTERRSIIAGLCTDLNNRTLVLHAKVSATKCCLVELQNAQMEHHCSPNRRLGLLEWNTRHIAL